MNLDNTTALVKFEAEWCGPCKQMDPIVEEVEEAGHEVIHIDVEQNQELAGEYFVQSLPTFLAFDDGDVIDQHRGMASKERLMELAP